MCVSLSAAYVLLRVKRNVKRHLRERNTVPKIFAETVQRYGDKTALIFEGTGERWTFNQLDEYSNRVANLLLQRGFKVGPSRELAAVVVELREGPSNLKGPVVFGLIICDILAKASYAVHKYVHKCVNWQCNESHLVGRCSLPASLEEEG